MQAGEEFVLSVLARIRKIVLARREHLGLGLRMRRHLEFRKSCVGLCWAADILKTSVAID